MIISHSVADMVLPRPLGRGNKTKHGVLAVSPEARLPFSAKIMTKHKELNN